MGAGGGGRDGDWGKGGRGKGVMQGARNLMMNECAPSFYSRNGEELF